MAGPDNANRGGDVSSREQIIRSIENSPVADLIDPETVVGEYTLTPPRSRDFAAGREGVERAPAKYRIIVTNEVDAYEEPLPVSRAFGVQVPLEAVGVVSDNFNGESRRPAKLSISNAPVEEFADLLDLIATLPSKDAMVHHNPLIKDDKNSKRVKEEQRNVRLRVWLYAESRERDNDFHFILGREPSLTPRTFMTMEVSGLPSANSGAFARLKAVRDAYKTFRDNRLPGRGYEIRLDPVLVEIQGSLFFDITHAHGTPPGPKKFRPDMPVIWEIHPISEIVFEP